MKINVVNCTGLIKDLICFYSQSEASAGAGVGLATHGFVFKKRVIIYIPKIEFI